MASKDPVQSLVGQLFIVGFNGFSVPPDFKQHIQDYNLGGVIYFKRNVQSPAQLAELSNELNFSCRLPTMQPLLVSIDHEGGKVNRLVKPFTKFPGNDYLGDVGSPKLGFQFGAVIGKELLAVGINMNYAPVVDVNTYRESPIIKNRAFSSDPEVCARMGSSVVRGLQKAGVMAVAKHFPGHGDTREDSHFTLPKLKKSLPDLEKCELIPFRRMVRSRVEGIMTAHILNEALDPKYPATLSEATLTGLLRNEMRYAKLIISDDMEMKAIADLYGANEAAVLAVKAGCDCLIYRGDAGFPVAPIEAIVKAVKDGEIKMEQLETSVKRIAAAKKAYISLQKPLDITEVGNNIGLPEHFQLADAITRKELPPNFVEDEA